jgi:hypothetical protein
VGSLQAVVTSVSPAELGCAVNSVVVRCVAFTRAKGNHFQNLILTAAHCNKMGGPRHTQIIIKVRIACCHAKWIMK